jgi:hypothetical protein
MPEYSIPKRSDLNNNSKTNPTAKTATSPAVKKAATNKAEEIPKKPTQNASAKPSKVNNLEMQKRIKRPKYKFVGKESFAETFQKLFPKAMIPTEKTNTMLGAIFLIVIVLALFQVPFAKIVKGETDISINIGLPLPFLQFELEDVNKTPLKIKNLLIDLLVYLALAYMIDVSINFIVDSPLMKPKKNEGKPQIFKNARSSMADRMAKRAAEERKKKEEEAAAKPKTEQNKANPTTTQKAPTPEPNAKN